MTRRLLAALALLIAFAIGAAPSHAQPAPPSDARRASDPASLLAAAADATAAGAHDRAIELAATVAADARASRSDRAEAQRLLGVAYFFRGDPERAEAAFLAYLRLDLDGRLDPALAPPEVVTFFEDVRSRHAAELRTLRPRPRRYALLNLLPPAGQIQNREARKAWFLGGALVALAATNITTYAVLRSWCRRDDFTCQSGERDVPDRARLLRSINYASGAALLGVYVYGVIDGFRGHRRRGREPSAPLTVAPVEGGVVVGIARSF
jgi:hypothetical protein